MPAAGSSRRFGQGATKLYMPLAGRTVIEWALQPFLGDARCVGIVIALAPEDQHFASLAATHRPKLRTVAGGAERSDSVRNALAAVEAPDDAWVLVHDAARPCVSPEEIDALLAAAGNDAVGGLLAAPLADTLKRGDAAGRVVETPSRASLWRALTPQMFRLGVLRTALTAAHTGARAPTDEAEAVEWLGAAPQLVPGSALNIKITAPADLALAEAILERRIPAQGGGTA